MKAVEELVKQYGGAWGKMCEDCIHHTCYPQTQWSPADEDCSSKGNGDYADTLDEILPDLITSYIHMGCNEDDAYTLALEEIEADSPHICPYYK